MKSEIECLTCIYNQILRISKVATDNNDKIELILKESAKYLGNANLNLTPPELAQPLYKLVYKATNNDDPYKKIKENHINTALNLYPKLKEIVEKGSDKLLESVKVAIMGNAIDLGSTFDNVEIDLEKFLMDNFELSDYGEFKKAIENERGILFIGDNAGETVFDRILIEFLTDLGKEVKYAVKSKPIINDATKEDALNSGIPVVLETGSNMAGTVLYSLSEEFINILNSSNLIIAKGQANYETLSHEELPIFFLLKIKCSPISRSIGYPIGTNILLKSKKFKLKY
ncbi:damage-control phosphatase ARMT1 family protein [Caldisericum exile]